MPMVGGVESLRVLVRRMEESPSKGEGCDERRCRRCGEKVEPGERDEDDEIGIIEKKIQALHTVNNEIIQRISQKMTSENLTIFEYKIRSEDVASDRNPPRYAVEEIATVVSCKQFVECWRVPPTAELPRVPDPDGIMYGNNKDIMDMKCRQFSDLIRINRQVIVSNRYTSMLREAIGLSFGQKFKQNFELVQVLLGMLETQLMGTESILQEKEAEINRVNEQMAQIFAQNDCVLSTPKYSFTNFTTRVTSIYGTVSYESKGTRLSSGIHRWKVKSSSKNGYHSHAYEVGVVTPSHVGAFGKVTGNTCSAWGINHHGTIIPAAGGSSSSGSYSLGSGVIFSFVLDCHVRTLSISINDEDPKVIPNIQLPVHIAFTGSGIEMVG
jgi:hypothetical protein